MWGWILPWWRHLAVPCSRARWCVLIWRLVCFIVKAGEFAGRCGCTVTVKVRSRSEELAALRLHRRWKQTAAGAQRTAALFQCVHAGGGKCCWRCECLCSLTRWAAQNYTPPVFYQRWFCAEQWISDLMEFNSLHVLDMVSKIPRSDTSDNIMRVLTELIIILSSQSAWDKIMNSISELWKYQITLKLDQLGWLVEKRKQRHHRDPTSGRAEKHQKWWDRFVSRCIMWIQRAKLV